MPMNKARFSPTRMLVGVSLCLGSAVSLPMPAAAACQAGQPGCVLPVGEAPPPVAQRTPPPIIEEGGGGIGWLPILVALAAIAALLLFVLDKDDEDAPVSP